MRTIWKFPLSIHAEQTISMPSGAEILSVQMQGNAMTLCAIVNPDKQPEKRIFYIVGTGHDFPDWLSISHHIGTVQQMSGALVWHIFERAA